MTKTRDLADLGGGFIQAGTGAVQRTVESKLQDVVSVKDFGAVGDGVADDTAAIQAAVNSGARTLLITKGTYRITSTVTISSAISIRVEPGATIRNDTTQELMINITGSGTRIEGGLWRGNININGIMQVAASNCIIENAEFIFSNRWALHIASGTFRNIVRNVLITNAIWSRTDASTVEYGALEVDGFDHWIQDCEVGAESGKTTITANAVAIGLFVKGSSHFISNAYSEYSEVGMKVDATETQFVNCRIDYSFGNGLVLTSNSANNQFSNFRVVGCGWAADNTYSGISVRGKQHQFNNVSISALSRVYPDGPTARTPVLLNGLIDTTQWSAASFKNKYLSIEVFAPCVNKITYNLNNPYLSSHFSLAASENRLTQAEANSTTYSASGVTHIDATACSTPTTVTNFTNGIPGQRLTIEGNSNVTLGGSLAGPAGAINMSTGRILEYAFLGTASLGYRWVLINFTYNQQGTWSPTIGGGWTGGTASNGLYVRAGNICTATCQLASLTYNTSSGSFCSLTLPFNAAQSSYQTIAVNGAESAFSRIVVGGVNSQIFFYNPTTASYLAGSTATPPTGFALSVTYRVA